MCLSKQFLYQYYVFKFYMSLHGTKTLKKNINHPWTLGKGNKAIKCSLKSTGLLLDADRHVLT